MNDQLRLVPYIGVAFSITVAFGGILDLMGRLVHLW